MGTQSKKRVMIEIDGELTNVSRTYLPEWLDCSDIVVLVLGSGDKKEEVDTKSCFDDPRATVHFEDAFGYFLEHFGDGNDDGTAEDEGLFYVIIMDALDPDDFGVFVDVSYFTTSEIFIIHLQIVFWDVHLSHGAISFFIVLGGKSVPNS